MFTRNGCPNCKTSKILLDKAGIKYQVINADEEKEITVKYGVKKAPTLLVPIDGKIVAFDNARALNNVRRNSSRRRRSGYDLCALRFKKQ
mgnify:CR=1 FL=1